MAGLATGSRVDPTSGTFILRNSGKPELRCHPPCFLLVKQRKTWMPATGAGMTVERLCQPTGAGLAEFHAEVAGEQLLQPGDRGWVHLTDRCDIGFEVGAGGEAVAFEHGLGQLEVFG